jgi:hypothetical protein
LISSSPRIGRRINYCPEWVTGNQHSLDVSCLVDAGYDVAWHDNRKAGTNGYDVYGQTIAADGTTVVCALETVAGAAGQVQPDEGWTGLVITPQRRLRVVDGLLTGLHEPKASHMALLEALARRAHVQPAT